MFLKRVQVPDFRIHKDVDITFEKEYVPSLFPLGSLNGGGKSTLLQLVFTLLHCSVDEERRLYIANLLNGYEVKGKKRHLATLELIDDNEEVKIHYYAVNDSYFDEDFSRDDYDSYTLTRLDFFYDNQYQKSRLEKEIEELSKVKIEDIGVRETILQKRNEMAKIEHMGINDYLVNIYEKLFVRKNLYFLTTYQTKDATNALVCYIEGYSNPDKVKTYLEKARDSIYLAAPSTQVYLFFPPEIRSELFTKTGPYRENKYVTYLNRAKAELSNFYPYDFVNPDILIGAINEARNKDFMEKQATGTYGNHYDRLINKINTLFPGKRLLVSEEFDRVIFVMDNEEKTELLPEDLSHGELKRLSLLLWVSSTIDAESIVLMDELEIALHPDWQYGIAGDITDWGQGHQYIIATHSYELCRAVTPGHVKELEPKLIKETPDGA